MEKIRWSHEAEQWLRDIYEYIAQDNPSAAEKVVTGIYCVFHGIRPPIPRESGQ